MSVKITESQRAFWKEFAWQLSAPTRAAIDEELTGLKSAEPEIPVSEQMREAARNQAVNSHDANTEGAAMNCLLEGGTARYLLEPGDFDCIYRAMEAQRRKEEGQEAALTREQTKFKLYRRGSEGFGYQCTNQRAGNERRRTPHIGASPDRRQSP